MKKNNGLESYDLDYILWLINGELSMPDNYYNKYVKEVLKTYHPDVGYSPLNDDCMCKSCNI